MSSKRRTAPRSLGGLLVLVLAFGLGVGCAGQEEQQEEKGGAPVTGEFVGTASAQDALVALFAREGSFPDELQVVAYVCNRQVGLTEPFELAEWYTGTATNNTLDLASTSGNTHLRATLEEDGARGTVELPNGESMTFEAATSAPGLTGLYELDLDEAGSNLVGSSFGGKSMNLAPIERDGVPGYEGTVTLPGGETLPYELFVLGGWLSQEDLAEMGPARTIVSEDGDSRGILDPIPLRKSQTTTQAIERGEQN